VVSGDTAFCPELVVFARGAEVLVVDACASAPDPELPPARRRIIEGLRAFHATPQECIDMAAEASVAKVVLTHHLPGAEPLFDASGYAGEVVVGNDLDVIEI
jgi:ribonuclease BN (tRNA processing enzyme)